MHVALIRIHLGYLDLIQSHVPGIGSDHVLGVAVCGHLVEVGVLDGAYDVGPDMERASHGDKVYPLALSRFPEMIPV